MPLGGHFHIVSQILRREVITHAQLTHPNIIPLLGVYRDYANGPPLMILPLIENGSLEEYIEHTALKGAAFIRIVSSRQRRRTG